MRVFLNITGMHSTKYGSLERYFVELGKLLHNRGDRLVIQYDSQPMSLSYLADLDRYGIEIVICDSAPKNVLPLARTIRQVAPSLIHTHFINKRTLFLLGLLKSFGILPPILAMVHGYDHLYWASRARFSYNRCDRLLAVSEAVNRDLHAGGVNPAKISTHYLGLFACPEALTKEAIVDRYSIPPSKFIISTIAFDSPVKGNHTLIEALRFTESSIHLIQFGVDPRKTELIKLAQLHGVSEKITWAGIIDNAAAHIAGTDLYVQPSSDGEGLPLGIMEAMRARLPVLATSVSGNAEAVEDGVTGSLIQANDPTRMAEEINRLAHLPEMLTKSGAAGRRRFESYFDGSQSVQKLVQVYDGMIGYDG